MTVEKDYQDYVIKNLQAWGVDFYRNSNSASKGFKTAVHSTTAFVGRLQGRKWFESKKKDKFPCNKFFPDLLFGCGQRVWMVEFGMKVGSTINHAERKEMQAVRMEHWEVNAGVWTFTVTSFDEAYEVLKQVARAIQKPIEIDMNGKKIK